MAKKADSAGNGKSPSKMAMVREAIGELGDGVKPLSIQSYIKEKYGEDMGATMISSYKSLIMRKGTAGGTGRGGRGGGGGDASVNLRDLETVRELMDRMGLPALQRAIQFLGGRK